MKFKDLEEGKEYSMDYQSFSDNQLITYVKKDGLLYNKDELRFSSMSCKELLHINFREKIKYVTFKEAIEHMKKGGKCQNLYTGISDTSPLKTEWYIFENALTWCQDHCMEHPIFNLCYLEPKWVLL